LKNITRKGDVTIVGQKIGSCGLPECIEKTADYIGWKEKRARKQPNRGLGMACCMFDSEVRNAPFSGSVAYVKVLEDGRVRIISGEFEWGQGSHTVLSQIAAEVLGVPLESVEFSELDTGAVPFALGPFGGGPVTVRGGNAVRMAAIAAREQLRAVAAGMLSVQPEELETKNQKIMVKSDPKKVLSLAQVASYAKFIIAEEILGRGHFEPNTVMRDPKTYYGNYSSGYTFAAQTAEVEVDPETGKVKILDFASAIDLGKAINPISAEGQNEGGIGQELGPIFMENIIYDKQGRVVNPNLIDYRLPTALDVPPIKNFLVESNEPNGPYGAKACGQVSNIPTAAALANAIYDAVGVRIKEQPITPDKILKALEEKRRKDNAPA
jgi:CO/xanthine dehydrogenase Mo-binding subunit